MLTGKPPFNYNKAHLIKHAKLHEEIYYPKFLSEGVVEILKNCLHRDPNKRQTSSVYFSEKLSELGIDYNIIQKDR
jgi:serine/threonine protein kinase